MCCICKPQSHHIIENFAKPISQQSLYSQKYANGSLFIFSFDLLQMLSQLGRNAVRETRP